MPLDPVHDETHWPEMPEEISGALREYLLAMQKAVDDRLRGDVHIDGDLTVGGTIITVAPGRFKTYTGS
jgi:hypothetical protein